MKFGHRNSFELLIVVAVSIAAIVWFVFQYSATTLLTILMLLFPLGVVIGFFQRFILIGAGVGKPGLLPIGLIGWCFGTTIFPMFVNFINDYSKLSVPTLYRMVNSPAGFAVLFSLGSLVTGLCVGALQAILLKHILGRALPWILVTARGYFLLGAIEAFAFVGAFATKSFVLGLAYDLRLGGLVALRWPLLFVILLSLVPVLAIVTIAVPTRKLLLQSPAG